MKLLDGELNLHPKVIAALKEKGWTSLTSVQLRAIPFILRGENVLIIAPTGMGKTEAAMLPVFSMMLEMGAEPVSVLYITPMKALINDLYERIKWWAERLGLEVARKHGDVSVRERSRRHRHIPHILITTPESLEIDLDWAPKFRVHYKNLRWVIVDELHEFAASKRGAQLALQLERLSKLAGRDLQRIGLSATIGDPWSAIELLSGSSRRPKRIIDEGGKKTAILSVRYVGEDSGMWRNLANTVREEIEKPSIIFVNSRYMAEKLKQALEEIGASDIFVHHSSVAPEVREKAERKLRRGELSAIVATKTLELGIDIGEIVKVVQVKSPGRVSSLIQRVGRSGHRLGLPSKGSIVSIGVFDLVESASLASLAYDGYVEPVVVKEIPLDVIARELQGILLEKKEASVKEVYEILSAHPYSKLTPKKFEKLLSYLESQGVIRRVGNKLRLGSTFYKIWKFRGSGKGRSWWARDFTEFFSLISDRDTFQVKHGERTIGNLDSVFVYRYLRPGDIIRLSGRSWKVKRIDVGAGRVDVEPSEEPGEVPLWRGEGISRSPMLARKFLEVSREGTSSISPRLIMDSVSRETLEEWSRRVRSALPPEAGPNTILYEIAGDEHIIVGPFGSEISETLALILLDVLIKEQGLNTYYRSSFIGFSLLNKAGLNLVEAIMNIDPGEVEERVLRALERSPILGQIIREIQLSFGKLGSIKEDDEFLVEEAKRQAIRDHLDIPGAIKIIESLKSGDLRVMRLARLTPLAESILKLPPVRPWLPDLAGRIARMLEGYAMSVIDLADALEVSEKTVEAKLKELRKAEYGDKRVFCFYDSIDEECKWALVRDASEIVAMEDFRESFEPRYLNEPLRIAFKAGQDSQLREIIVTPAIVIENWDKLEKEFPDEIYMVKISPAYAPATRELTITFYNVPKTILKYLILNAALILQRRRARIYY
ncbi:MAG: DEAD/DEAH box helicase [Desulfurococcales archaeon]|nr:DEAD/DEAH box helicase [Desulfurococcales archaeon]